MTEHTPSSMNALPQRLMQHVVQRAGAPGGRGQLSVVANPRNAIGGWDGLPPLLTGVVAPTRDAVVALPPNVASEGARRVHGLRGATLSERLQVLPELLGKPGHTVECVALRWTLAPVDLPTAGEWVEATSSRLPEWLRPFGGRALVAFDERGDYLAGVGVKRHDHLVNEISVGTAPHARGRGLARRLVAQAARHILRQGAVPTYLHALDNVASSRVATAAGFVDRGWLAVMLSETPLAELGGGSTAAA